MTTGETFTSRDFSTPPPFTPGHGFGPRTDGFWKRAIRKRKDLPVWQEILIVLVVVFFLAVIVRTFLVSAYYIPSGSMANTIQPGDRVLVNKAVYDFRNPERGEVVVFKDASWAQENFADQNASLFSRIGSGLGGLVGISDPGAHDFVKRVIGVPGDYVACCDVDGRITVNGQPIDEPYVTLNAPVANAATPSSGCGVRNFKYTTVPKGELFVLGDHRLVSEDSRCAGLVPISDVIGKAEAVIWPTSRWTDLSSIPSSFKSVPAPSAMEPSAPVRVDIGASSGGAVLALPLLSVFGVSTRSWVVLRGKRRTLRS